MEKRLSFGSRIPWWQRKEGEEEESKREERDERRKTIEHKSVTDGFSPKYSFNSER